MGGYVVRAENMRNAYRILVWKHQDHLKFVGANMRIILKCILRKRCRRLHAKLELLRTWTGARWFS